MSVRIERHHFTVAEYERMGEVGIFSESDRVELIEGEIVEMSPIGERHAACVGRLTQLLALLLQRGAILWVQNPIRLNDYSQTQPDVAVLRPRDDFYERSLPRPEDVLLVIEVSDATLEFDRQIKLPLYARAGIQEAWVVNLGDARIETYARPAGDAYQMEASFARGEEVQSQAFAGLLVGVSAVLG